MSIRQIPIRPSTNIANVSYDDDTQEMTIQFYGRNALSGAIYVHTQVPANVADGFTEAISTGQYFRLNVLHLFPFQRIQ